MEKVQKKSIQKVFELLALNGISYTCWKDLQELDILTTGKDIELDLLVAFEDKEKFQTLLKNNNFVFLKGRKGFNNPLINHFVKFSEGKHFHLHVYYSIITGDHFLKEYNIPITKFLLDNSISIKEVNRVSQETEFLIAFIRSILKTPVYSSGFKVSELKLMKDKKNISFQNISNSLISNLKIDTNPTEIQAACNAITSLKRFDYSLYKIRKKFREYRNGNPFSLFILKISLLWKVYFLRFKKENTKVLAQKGLSVGIIGTDGSGKTSLTHQLFKIFRKKLTIKRIYLGSNLKHMSFRTKIFYYLFKSAKISKLFIRKSELAWLVYFYFYYFLEYNKYVDRKIAINKGRQYEKKNFLVIYERFPLVGLYDVPYKVQEIKNGFKWKPGYLYKTLVTSIKELENKIDNLPLPEKLFFIYTDFEEIKKRRKLTPSEKLDITNKLHLFRNYGKNILTIVPNNESIDNTLNRLTNEINTLLCKYN